MKNRTLSNKYDTNIKYEGILIGVIGLENIYEVKAKYYVTLGKSEYKRRGIVKTASDILFRYTFL